jgi:tRNA 2-thiouridine synthesizing protein A
VKLGNHKAMFDTKFEASHESVYGWHFYRQPRGSNSESTTKGQIRLREKQKVNARSSSGTLIARNSRRSDIQENIAVADKATEEVCWLKFKQEEYMPEKSLDMRGMKCPLPTLKMLSLSREMKAGEILEVLADCSTFEADVRKFCADTKRALLFIKTEGSAKRVQVRM